jgi:hypothetical protein
MLYRLGLPIPQGLEGRFVADAMTAAVLAVQAPRYGADGLHAPDVGSGALDPEAEAEILQRLQALGYVE